MRLDALSATSTDSITGEKPPQKKVLIIGEAGDGKSTLINYLRDEEHSTEAATGKEPTGITKQISSYVGKPLGGFEVIYLDSPGIGDADVNPIALVAMIEKELDGIEGSITAVLVCTSKFERISLGQQVVKLIIEKGIVNGKDREQQWQNIFLVGTKCDKQDEDDVICFTRKTVPLFFKNASGALNNYAIVHQGDYSSLLELLKKAMQLQKIVYTVPDKDDLGAHLGDILGIDRQESIAALELARRKLKEKVTGLKLGSLIAIKLASTSVISSATVKAAFKEGGRTGMKGAVLSPAGLVADLGQAGCELAGHPGYGKVVGSCGNAAIGGGVGFLFGGPFGAAAGAAAATGLWAVAEGVGALIDGGESWKKALESSGSQPAVGQKSSKDESAAVIEALKAQRTAFESLEAASFEDVQSMIQLHETSAKQVCALGEVALVTPIITWLAKFLEESKVVQIMNRRAANLLLHQAAKEREQRKGSCNNPMIDASERTPLTIPILTATSTPSAPRAAPDSYGRTSTVTTLADIKMEGASQTKEVEAMQKQLDQMNEKLQETNEMLCQMSASMLEKQSPKSSTGALSYVANIIGAVATNIVACRICNYALDTALHRVGVGPMSSMVKELSEIRISADTAAKAATMASDGIKVAADASKEAAFYSKTATAATTANLVTNLVMGGGGGSGGGLNFSKLPKNLMVQEAGGGHWDPDAIGQGAYVK